MCCAKCVHSHEHIQIMPDISSFMVFCLMFSKERDQAREKETHEYGKKLSLCGMFGVQLFFPLIVLHSELGYVCVCVWLWFFPQLIVAY